MPGPTAEDLTGRKFGKWEVLGRAENPRNDGPVWLCRCACGTERVLPSGRLVQGRSTCCKACSYARRFAKSPKLQKHAAKLGRKVWPRACGTCGKKFKGRPFQRFCSPKCQPHMIARRKGKAGDKAG